MRPFQPNIFQASILAVCCLLSLDTAHAAEPDVKALMEPVEQFTKAFNAGQSAYPAEVFTSDAVVVDGFAPFVWNGPDAARTWYEALMGQTPEAHQAFLDQRFHLELGAPTLVRTDGDCAYLVLPGIDRWDSKGVGHFEKAQWAITLCKTPAGWRISSHSWTIVAEQ